MSEDCPKGAVRPLAILSSELIHQFLEPGVRGLHSFFDRPERS